MDTSFVVTSNIDAHFEKSGFPSSEVAQIHGWYQLIFSISLPWSGKHWQCGGVPSKNNSFMLFERGPCCKKIFDAPLPSEYTVSTLIAFLLPKR